MFFGEYLVQKNIITKIQLVDALVLQIKSTPSYAEIVFEKKLLSEDEILKIFSEQIKNGYEFKQAAIQLNLWSEHIENKIEDYLTEYKMPLGQILVKNNTTQYDVLTKALDEYLVAITDKPAPNRPQSKPQAQVQQQYHLQAHQHNQSQVQSNEHQKSETKTTSVSKSSLLSAVFAKVDPDIAKEYLEKFNENYLAELRNLFDKLNDPSLSVDINLELHKMLHTLFGSSKFCKLNLTSELILNLENFSKSTFEKISSINQEQFNQKINIFNSALDALWILRDSIQNNFSEELFWNDSKDMYQKSINELKNL